MAEIENTENTEVSKSGNGMLRLPYAIAKNKGLSTDGMTPSQVWEMLKGKGISKEAEEKKFLDSQKTGIKDEPRDEPEQFFEEPKNLTNNLRSGTISVEERAKLLSEIRSGKLSISEIESHPFITTAAKRSDENSLKGYTHEINTPEREDLRNDIAKKLSEKGSYNPNTGKFDGEVKRENKAVIIIGLPAAGKSQKLAEPLSSKFGMRIVDADEAKKMLPEFDNGFGADRVHKESANLIADSKLTDLATRKGDNVIFPILGKKHSSIEKKRKYLEARGYNVYLALNEVSNDTSVRRAAGRFVEKNRFLPLNMIREVGDKPTRAYAKAKTNGKFKGYLHLNNDVPFGQNPVIIEDKEGLLK